MPAFQASDESSILSARTKVKAPHSRCFYFGMNWGGFCYDKGMSTTSYLRFFTNWKYYFTFLWLIAIAFTIVIIVSYIQLSRTVDQNPASGIAYVGIGAYILYLLLLVGFIFLNYVVRKKIAHRNKFSNHFLAASWVTIAVLIIATIGLFIFNQQSQSNYEKNIAPKLTQCYEEYLAGTRSTPYENCIKSKQ